jgi:hypothetical protein
MGSSVAIDASLLEGVAWYAELQSAKSMVGILRTAQRLRIIIVFIDPTLSIFLYFLFSFLFLSFFFFLLG